MRDHPIPQVSEPRQFRAIGVVRGIYSPVDADHFTRGRLEDAEGTVLDAVVLGRVLTLMRRHLMMDKPHLWVVYPRSREIDHLHLQIAGVWEPSSLSKSTSNLNHSVDEIHPFIDVLPEGDDYFSIRGELIYSRLETNDIVIRVRQQNRSDGKRQIPFKLQLKGVLPVEALRSFVSLDVRRRGQELHLEDFEIIGPIINRGNKRPKGKKTNS